MIPLKHSRKALSRVDGKSFYCTTPEIFSQHWRCREVLPRCRGSKKAAVRRTRGLNLILLAVTPGLRGPKKLGHA